MNPYPFFGAIILITASLGYGFWERGNAESWELKYTSLQTSYSLAADKARQDAQAQENKDLDALHAQQVYALALEQKQKEQIQNQLSVYQLKLQEASKEKNLPHLCSAIQIPSDLLPGK